jgi:hypothetical protein
VWKSKFNGAFVLNHRVDLHAIDATPARWRGDAGSSPLVHPTHWLISTQARAEREKRAVAPLIFRVACDDGMLGDVPLRKGDGVVASLRLAPDLSFGAGRRACAGREVALAVAAAAVEARLSGGVAKIA